MVLWSQILFYKYLITNPLFQPYNKFNLKLGMDRSGLIFLDRSFILLVFRIGIFRLLLDYSGGEFLPAYI